ncbi:MAG: cation transporter, partial [Gemmatimonadaceae bacterium]
MSDRASGDGDNHDHGAPGHDHAAHASVRGLRLALGLTATLLVVEIIGGILSNSLALLADAGHMLTDVGALALSLFVAWFTTQPSSPRK